MRLSLSPGVLHRIADAAVETFMKFWDSFVEATSNTTLASHTPDEGDSWSLVDQITSCTLMVNYFDNYLEEETSTASDGVRYLPLLSAGDYDDDHWGELVIESADGSVDDTAQLIVRYQSGINAYYLIFNDQKIELWKRVNTTWTKLVESASTSIEDADQLALGVCGDLITMYLYHAPFLWAIDTAISSGGRPGIGMGATGQYTTDEPGSNSFDGAWAGNGDFDSMRVFRDNFNDVSGGTDLISRTPPRGDSYTRVYQSGGGKYETNATYDYADTNISDPAGCIYTLDHLTLNSANYGVGIYTTDAGGSNEATFLILRYQDNNNFYCVELGGNTGQIRKKVSGSWSTIGSSFTIDNTGSWFRFAISGSTLFFWQTGKLLAQETDTSITDEGKAAIGAGDVRDSSNDLNAQTIDDIEVFRWDIPDSNIVMSDNFSGSLSTEWTETDPDGVIGIVSNQLKIVDPDDTEPSFFTNQIKSKDSNNAPWSFVQGKVTWDYNEWFYLYDSGALMLWVDNNNYASIQPSVASTAGRYRLRIVQGGIERYDNEPSVTQNKDVKIEYNSSTGYIRFWYWSGSAWTQMGTTQTWDLGVTTHALITAKLSWIYTGGNTPFFVDDVYFSNLPYSTHYPT